MASCALADLSTGLFWFHLDNILLVEVEVYWLAGLNLLDDSEYLYPRLEEKLRIDYKLLCHVVSIALAAPQTPIAASLNGCAVKDTSSGLVLTLLAALNPLLTS